MNRIFLRFVHDTYKYRLTSWKNSHGINFPLVKEMYPSKNDLYISRCYTLHTWKNQCEKSEKDYANDPEVKEWLKEISADFENELNDEKNSLNKMNESSKEMKDEKTYEFESKKITKRKAPAVVNPWSQFTSTKFNKLDSSTSKVIYDFNEEQLRREAGIKDEDIEPPEQIVLQRGVTGVFDVEELVDLLRAENAKDIVTIQMPEHLNYVDYMVIVSCKSKRHINSLAEVTRQIYNKKRFRKDNSTLVEGKDSEWIAMDLGNIALHIMSPEMREIYDLESLWTVGAEFDDKSNQSLQESLDPFSLDQSIINLHLQEYNAKDNSTVT